MYLVEYILFNKRVSTKKRLMLREKWGGKKISTCEYK